MSTPGDYLLQAVHENEAYGEGVMVTWETRIEKIPKNKVFCRPAAVSCCSPRRSDRGEESW